MADDTKRVHIFLAVPGWRLSPYHAQSRERLVVECLSQGIDLTIHPDMTSGIERARNISCAKMLETDATHLLFIDSDIIFDPADVFAMIGTGFDVVGGAYPKKSVNWEAAKCAVENGVSADDLPQHAGHFVFNPKPGVATGATDKQTGARYVQVSEIGTGFLMIRREALERFIRYWKDEIAYVTDYEPRGEVAWNIWDHERDADCLLERAARALRHQALRFECDPTSEQLHALSLRGIEYAQALKAGKSSLGRYLTEDYAFCRRWQMMGGKVMMAIDARLMHQGTTVFEGHLGHSYRAASDEATP